MKKVIILGAGGTLAGPVIEALQKLNDVAMTLFVRNKRRLQPKYTQNVNEVDYELTRQRRTGTGTGDIQK